jgi:hypothetical protein
MEAAVAPVEYAVAVDEYLGQAALGEASRRVHRISLTGCAWPLVGRPIPEAVFVTGRRAPARAGDRWPVTGQARMSCRRAAELFTTLTRPLDPRVTAGRCTSSAD